MSGRFVRLAMALTLCGCVVYGVGMAIAAGEQNPSQRPKRLMTSPPGSQMYPLKVGAAYPPYRPMQAVPTYDWGYFGARSSQSCVNHVDTQGGYRQTIFSPRF